MAENDPTVLMEGVRIIFRNFRGEPSQFNKEGTRNFGVILPTVELAEQMTVDDWNVKWLEPREGDEEELEKTPWLPVEVAYDKGRPPRIVMISSQGIRTILNEGTVETLDGADIVNVDMIVRPYHWEVNGKGGVKAYLQSMYVIVEEDALERKYAELAQDLDR
jgi:hypothetical protein